MYYRQDYNMLICLANAKRAGMEGSYVLQGTPEYERLALQRSNLQDLMNQQFNSFDNQVRNISAPLRYEAKLQKPPQEIGINKNQAMEQLKVLLLKSGGEEDQTRNVPGDSSATNLSSFDYYQKHLWNGANTELDEKFEDKLPGLRPDTPLSDVFSDTSSGLGTMPSPVSDFECAPELAPGLSNAEPTCSGTTPSIEGSEPEQTPVTLPPLPKDNIQYQGRNILDLYNNMTYQWAFQMAVLPQHNLVTHFQYRSLYHRLGPYGMAEELGQEKCFFCDFDFVVPKY